MKIRDDFFIEKTPSACKEILQSLKGVSIGKLTRCSWENFSEFDPDKLYDISKEDFFRLTSGGIIIEFDNKLIIGIYSQENLNSLIIWGERNSKGEKADDYYLSDDNYLIENSNSEYTRMRERNLTGQIIQDVQILKTSPKSDKYRELANEVGLLFKLENGEELIFSHNLIPASDSFCITYGNEIPKELRNEFQDIESI